MIWIPSNKLTYPKIWEKENHRLKHAIFGGYVSSLEVYSRLLWACIKHLGPQPQLPDSRTTQSSHVQYLWSHQSPMPYGPENRLNLLLLWHAKERVEATRRSLRPSKNVIILSCCHHHVIINTLSSWYHHHGTIIVVIIIIIIIIISIIIWSSSCFSVQCYTIWCKHQLSFLRYPVSSLHSWHK